jgi:hypothetical protein
MTEWFHERYISRAEHEEIVAYYAKLVAQLYRQVTELRAAGVDAQAIDRIIAHGKHKAERETRRAIEKFPDERGSNIVVVDFRNRRDGHLPS